MIKNINHTREFEYIEEETNKTKFMRVQYNIVLKDGKVQNVFNEFGNTVTKNSECFQYYSEMYNS